MDRELQAFINRNYGRASHMPTMPDHFNFGTIMALFYDTFRQISISQILISRLSTFEGLV